MYDLIGLDTFGIEKWANKAVQDIITQRKYDQDLRSSSKTDKLKEMFATQALIMGQEITTEAQYIKART